MKLLTAVTEVDGSPEMLLYISLNIDLEKLNSSEHVSPEGISWKRF